MHLRTDFVRVTLFTALGFASNACSTSDSTVTPSPNGSGANLNKPKQPTHPSACGESQPLTSDGKPTGLAECANGLIHRTSADATCVSKLEGLDEPIGTVDDPENQCTKHADCAEHPYGYCERGTSCLDGSLHCKYGCLSDSDCDANEACACGDPVGQCVPSDCREDADCGGGLLCQLGHNGFRCQQPEDECAVDADCPEEVGRLAMCDGSERKTCSNVVCGRPFLVAGMARLANAVPQAFEPTAGSSGLVGCDELPPEMREDLGQHWASIGLMEHASIAAFARFALQLMHLGAPAHLLVAAQQAMVDETAHATACFGIATQLLGRPVGPGKLPMDDALSHTTLEDVVRLTIREGCVGETIAALEAAEAAAQCSEPHIKTSLVTIEADELRHAELAWRFVQWALAQDANVSSTNDLTTVVAEEFQAALAAAGVDDVATSPVNEALATRYGVLSDSARRAIRRAALASVIAPCATALLAGSRSARLAGLGAALGHASA